MGRSFKHIPETHHPQKVESKTRVLQYQNEKKGKDTIIFKSSRADGFCIEIHGNIYIDDFRIAMAVMNGFIE